MKSIRSSLLLAAAGAAALASPAFAGHEITDPSKDGKTVAPVREWFPETPVGLITVGGMFSQHGNGVFLDSITGLWAPRTKDAFLFLNSRYHYEDDSQFISSTGVGFRKLLPNRDVILGVNAYYDSISSERNSDFQQLGLGAEVLTKWVDARVNYYLPNNDEIQVEGHTERHTNSSFSNGFASTTTRRDKFVRREAALEGLNAELGVLLPIERIEVRLFGGFYHYENPFGGDYNGFKARLEARLLPGVIADVEYWDDAKLMGGHWTGELRVSVPFSLYNLAMGRNPFEGIEDSFTPRKREFQERLSEMVIRSHRIQTTTSGEILAKRTTKTVGFQNNPAVIGETLPLE